MSGRRVSYGDAICEGFYYLMETYAEVFAIGQGLWAPWYVGNSMKDLDVVFGKERVMDSPVSEAACTGVAIGASLHGYKPIVVHPRMDFLILAIDQIVTQAAKWNSMFGGRMSPAVTFRGIINRGGEQGAQHSQALHSWFAHVPGLRVVMPSSPQDARDLLIASVLDPGPVLYLDDRWLYEVSTEIGEVRELRLSEEMPQVVRAGGDVTIVGSGYVTQLALEASEILAQKGIEAEIVDLRILNPLDVTVILESVRKTGRLLALDGGWKSCGLAAEIVARVCESVAPSELRCSPARVCVIDAPAPTSRALEALCYPNAQHVADVAVSMMGACGIIGEIRSDSLADAGCRIVGGGAAAKLSDR